jgi:SagB-type dehydrogenase family enzyme
MKPFQSLDIKETIKKNRDFLKAHLWGEWKLKDLNTDQRQGVPPPPLEKPFAEGATLIFLPDPGSSNIGSMPLNEAIARRKSRREFSAQPLSLDELSFLLWATQGVHEIIRDGTATRRTVPSGGARNPFETYLFINNVENLSPGLYRYLPIEHNLLFLYENQYLAEKVHVACYQEFVKDGAVVFIWTTIPYRTEWRYSFLSHKVIAQETGHICQNLYLASESIGAGTCALGTYNQNEIDAILAVDGEDEFAIYIAVVGKIPA